MYKNKYQLTFEFFDTINQAIEFRDRILKNANDYYRKNKKISITNWESSDRTEKKIICWYYV